MHPIHINVAYREGQQSFSPEACVCSVFLGSWFGTEARTPLVKHITNVSQTRLSLDSAKGLGESSGATFDEEMALLSAAFLRLPWGRSAGYFLHLWL